MTNETPLPTSVAFDGNVKIDDNIISKGIVETIHEDEEIRTTANTTEPTTTQTRQKRIPLPFRDTHGTGFSIPLIDCPVPPFEIKGDDVLLTLNLSGFNMDVLVEDRAEAWQKLPHLHPVIFKNVYVVAYVSDSSLNTSPYSAVKNASELHLKAFGNDLFMNFDLGVIDKSYIDIILNHIKITHMQLQADGSSPSDWSEGKVSP